MSKIQKDLVAEIENKNNKQRDIAEKYQAAFNLIPCGGWRKINTAIANRWPSKSGLARVKTMAWKIHSE